MTMAVVTTIQAQTAVSTQLDSTRLDSCRGPISEARESGRGGGDSGAPRRHSTPNDPHLATPRPDVPLAGRRAEAGHDLGLELRQGMGHPNWPSWRRSSDPRPNRSSLSPASIQCVELGGWM